jgi:hypothetical protein
MLCPITSIEPNDGILLHDELMAQKPDAALLADIYPQLSSNDSPR